MLLLTLASLAPRAEPRHQQRAGGGIATDLAHDRSDVELRAVREVGRELDRGVQLPETLPRDVETGQDTRFASDDARGATSPGRHGHLCRDVTVTAEILGKRPAAEVCDLAAHARTLSGDGRVFTW